MDLGAPAAGSIKYFHDVFEASLRSDKIIGPTKKRILKEINKGPIHGYGLADRLEISLSSAYEHLKDLREGGFVEIRETGRKKVYFLTDRGKHLLKALE